MSDRHHSLLVMLDKDYREDDLTELMRAIGCFEKVISVKLNVSGPGQAVAEKRIKQELIAKLIGALK